MEEYRPYKPPCVKLRLDRPNNSIRLPLYPINELVDAPIRIAIVMEVFILGYPFKIELPGYSVWKRGSIRAGACLPYVSARVGCEAKRVHAC